MAEKVLFVDDEEDVLDSLRRLFVEKNMDVLFASNGAEAIEIVRHNHIAVVVSDNLMPGINGVDLLCMISEISPDTIKILMTIYIDLEAAVDALNRCGAYKFFIKPWNNNELVEEIEGAVLRHRTITSLRDADEATMLSIAETIELKDHYTRGHCERVAQYSLMIADEIDLGDGIKKEIKYGSWLHDCGKIGVPKTILNKKGPLSAEEFEIIKKHPVWGADVVRQASLTETVFNIIFSHHEKYGGNGYPSGTSGEDIPLEARIVAIADIFDAVTSDRPYNARRSFRGAMDIISSLKRRDLDPYLVDVFLEALRKRYRKKIYR